MRNTGTIRDNFEEIESEGSDAESNRKPYVDKEKSPGPGKYLSETMTSTIGKPKMTHNYPGNFGNTVQRFREKPLGTTLGPG